MKNWKEWWSFWIFSFAFAIAVAGPTAYYWKDAPDWMARRAPASAPLASTFFPCHCDHQHLMVAHEKGSGYEMVSVAKYDTKSECIQKMIEAPYCTPIVPAE